MSQVVEFRLESGEVVYLEAPEDGGSGIRPASRGEKQVVKAAGTFEAALERVKPAARAVVQAFKELNEPAEIGLEFGLSFKTEANVFVLTGEAEATFKLTLKWTADKR